MSSWEGEVIGSGPGGITVADRARALGLPVLEGSMRQVAWGTRVRDDLVVGAHERFVKGQEASMSREEFDRAILGPAKQVRRAGWWIDHREMPTGALQELLQDAQDEGKR